jgi:hypothetical protein
MTLILTALNSDYVVQLSDRRLTTGRRVVDEESNKALLVHLSDGRLVFGFTGLAKAGDFETTTFLTDIVMAACPPDHSVAGTTERLSSTATAKWRDQRVAARVPTDKRQLTISVFGFGPGRYHHGPVPGGLVISNTRWTGSSWDVRSGFSVVKRFTAKPGTDLSKATVIHPIGATGGITEEAVSPIRRMLEDHRLPDAIVGKGVELMRAWSQLRPAAGTVGDQISSIVVPADIREGWTFDYHTAQPTPTIHHPIFIEATGRSAPFASRLEITQQQGFMAVPKAGRNEPCPCGSGRKYKRCHGGNSTGSKGELV